MSARKVFPVPELPRIIKTLTGRDPSVRADVNFSISSEIKIKDLLTINVLIGHHGLTFNLSH